LNIKWISYFVNKIIYYNNIKKITMTRKVQTLLFLILSVILIFLIDRSADVFAQGVVSFEIPNVSNTSQIIFSNQTSNVTTPGLESGSVIVYSDSNRLSQAATANEIAIRNLATQRALESAAANNQITSDEYETKVPLRQSLASSNNDPLQFVPYEAIIKIKTSVDGACSNITSIECRNEFGFGSEVYTNVNNKIESIYLPGSEQGWTLTYYPRHQLNIL